MDYSPKLKTAMEEIKSILKKHDITGLAVIHTPGFSEYLLHVEASYSCMKFDGRRLGVKTNDINKNPAEFKKLTDTCNMLVHFSDIGLHVLSGVEGLLERLKEKVEIVEGEGKITGHDEQNN
jgi:hypothetical protein